MFAESFFVESDALLAQDERFGLDITNVFFIEIVFLIGEALYELALGEIVFEHLSRCWKTDKAYAMLMIFRSRLLAWLPKKTALLPSISSQVLARRV